MPPTKKAKKQKSKKAKIYIFKDKPGRAAPSAAPCLEDKLVEE